MGRIAKKEASLSPFVYDGTQYKTIAEVFEAAGIKDPTHCKILRFRILYHGWDCDRAVATPIKRKRKRRKYVRCHGKTYKSLKECLEDKGIYSKSLYYRICKRVERGNSIQEAIDMENLNG